MKSKLKQPQTDASKAGIYVYCILKCPHLPGDASGQNLSLDINREGVAPQSKPYLLPLERIGALVSDVPWEEFSEQTLKSNLSNPQWLWSKMQRHEDVIRCAMQTQTVLPMKFGVVFQDASELIATLKEKTPELEEALKELEGKEEWRVRVFCHWGKLRQVIAESGRIMERLEAETKKAGPGHVYWLHKKRERLYEEEMEKEIQRSLVTLHRDLRLRAQDSAVEILTFRQLEAQGNPPANAQPGAKQPPGARSAQHLVLKGAYLTQRKLRQPFVEKANWFQKQLSGAFQLFLSGPWAPYSFLPENLFDPALSPTWKQN